LVFRRRVLWAVTLVWLLAMSPACADDETEQAAPSALDDDSVTVGSFDFAESELLAELYSQALETIGVDVDRAFRLGPRELVAPALTRGLIELVPEYAGTALEFVSLGSVPSQPDMRATYDALVREVVGRRIVALAPAAAQNVNAIVVTRETARRYDLDEISDLAELAPSMIFGGPPECPNRPFCLAGLERVYGLKFDTFIPLDVGDAVTRQALRRGDIDVALLFTTDPAIDGFVVLRDDRGLQPAENVVPLVHREVVDRWGAELVSALDAVSAHLTTDELRALNGAMADGEDAAQVAAAWLAEQELT
jgi:osmoprotectant transport system substrate-binding protein